MEENIEPINNDDYFLDENGNIKITGVGIRHVYEPKSKRRWYQTPSTRDYITGKVDDRLYGDGAKSLERAARDYQYLSEDFSRHTYGPKFMARKYDKFGGIDLDLIISAIQNAEEGYNSVKTKFESGEISEREFNRITRKYQRTLNNLNENYKSLYEVWHGKNDIQLVRTQSSVSAAPFVLGTVGLPFAIIGGIEGAVAAAPYIGKVGSWLANLSRTGIQNNFVKDLLVGSTIGMIGDQVVRETTEYDGIADGLVKQAAKLYYDVKIPDGRITSSISPADYKTEDGKTDWDAWNEVQLKNVKMLENKEYQKFLNSNTYLGLTFGAEFLNPLNWVSPLSMASKVGLSRSFDKFGNMLTDGFKLDPINMQNNIFKQDMYEHMGPDRLSSEQVLNIFEKYPNLRLVNNSGHYYERPGKVTPFSLWSAKRQLEKASKNVETYGGEYLKPYIDEAREKLNTLKYGKLFPFETGNVSEIDGYGFRVNFPEGHIYYENGVPIVPYTSKPAPQLLIRGPQFEYLGGYNPNRRTFANGKVKLGAINGEMGSATISNISDNPNLLIDSEGNINFAGYENLKRIIAQKLNKPVSEIETLLKTDGLEDHLLRSAYSAQMIPLPKGVTRQELVLGALLHDVGRLSVAIDNSSAHAQVGSDLLAGVNFEGMTDDILTAIKYHMDRESLNAFRQTGVENGINYPLLQAISAADVLRGRNYDAGRLEFPYLFGYEVENPIQIPDHPFGEQMFNINKFLESKGYPKIDLNLPPSKQWELLQDRVKQANTFVRGVTVESGGDDVVANFDVKNKGEILDILATTPVRRFNGQHRTFDDPNFGKFIGLNKVDNGTIYHSNSADFSSDYGELRTIRRGTVYDYRRLPGETPYQYVERLMPVYLDGYQLSNYTIPWQETKTILPKYITDIIIPENVRKLYEKFGLDENVAKLNYFGAGVDGVQIIPALQHQHYVTDYPHFRQNMLIRTGANAGAYVGPFYKPAFHKVEGKVPLSTLKKHGGKL